MSLAWATITRWVTCPLMSSPRMSWARALASSGLSASLTPPALPRPPVFTCALTTTREPISRAIASAWSGVSATPPGSTGTPCEASRSRAWYSKRSTNRDGNSHPSRRSHRHRGPCPGSRTPGGAAQSGDDVVGRGGAGEPAHPVPQGAVGMVTVGGVAEHEGGDVVDTRGGQPVEHLGEQPRRRPGHPDGVGVLLHD